MRRGKDTELKHSNQGKLQVIRLIRTSICTSSEASIHTLIAFVLAEDLSTFHNRLTIDDHSLVEVMLESLSALDKLREGAGINTGWSSVPVGGIIKRKPQLGYRPQELELVTNLATATTVATSRLLPSMTLLSAFGSIFAVNLCHSFKIMEL